MTKPTSQHLQTQIISKPGAVVEMKSVSIPPRIHEAIARGFKEGRQAALPARDAVKPLR